MAPSPRYADQQHFGGGLAVTVSTSSTPTRQIHFLESRCYRFSILGSPSPDVPLTLTLPYDVRNFPEGPYFVIFNVDHPTFPLTSIVDIEVETVAATPVCTIQPGENALIILRNNVTAAGTWFAHVTASAPKAVYA